MYWCPAVHIWRRHRRAKPRERFDGGSLPVESRSVRRRAAAGVGRREVSAEGGQSLEHLHVPECRREECYCFPVLRLVLDIRSGLHQQVYVGRPT